MVIGCGSARASRSSDLYRDAEVDDYFLATYAAVAAGSTSTWPGTTRSARALRAFAQHVPAGRRLEDEELHAGGSAGRAAAGQPLRSTHAHRVRRAAQLVYYWFQQRGA